MPRSKYRILGQVGQGQFGRVYFAVHRQTGEIVALKDLDKNKFPTRLFLREFTHLTSLQHANIVSCQGLEYSSTGRYLVLDYCEGGTLRDVMSSGSKISPFQSLKLIGDILLALDQAHDRNVVHCDLKPENILLKITKEGWTACVSDFGIARLKLETAGPTGRGYTGTPAYMAPERFYGQYSPSSDLYAVGVMLYELIIGKRPFSGMPGELMSAHLNQEIEVPRELPILLRSTIATALQKLPQKRFTSANEMLRSVRMAAQVLLAEKYTTRCLSAIPLEPPSSNPVEILAYEPLIAPVSHLAIDNRQVYLATRDRVQGRIYVDNTLDGVPTQKWQFQLDAPIVDLTVRPQGVFATIYSSQKYAFYCLTKKAIDLMYSLFGNADDSESNKPVPLLSVEANNLISAIESQGRWLAIACDRLSESLTSSVALKLFSLPKLKPFQLAFDSSLPLQLIPLDSRHGLAIFSAADEGKDGTVFRLFNRRAGLIDTVSLPLTLHHITPSVSEPYRLFAIEKGDPAIGVFIDLKPFKVARVALDIVPEFILSREWGYIIADRAGQFRLLDRSGNAIGRFEVSLPPTAIAAFGEFKLLVATWSNRMGMLYKLDFQKAVNFKQEDED